jgi:hypothetical protein
VKIKELTKAINFCENLTQFNKWVKKTKSLTAKSKLNNDIRIFLLANKFFDTTN